jgi:hypothetical protein
MAKRKKGAKVQKRGKLRRGNSAKRGKPRKVAKAAAARAKPKPAAAKKAARVRQTKQPVAPAVETVAVEHAAPEFEEVNKVSPGPDEAAE